MSWARFNSHLPGEGRGPVGKVAVTTRSIHQLWFPNWAPAFAGVVAPENSPQN